MTSRISWPEDEEDTDVEFLQPGSEAGDFDDDTNHDLAAQRKAKAQQVPSTTEIVALSQHLIDRDLAEAWRAEARKTFEKLLAEGKSEKEAWEIAVSRHLPKPPS